MPTFIVPNLTRGRYLKNKKYLPVPIFYAPQNTVSIASGEVLRKLLQQRANETSDLHMYKPIVSTKTLQPHATRVNKRKTGLSFLKPK
jgi:hypothetical protein